MKERKTRITNPENKHFAIWGILRDDGRSMRWLARKGGMSFHHIYHVKYGQRTATADFRARCSMAIGMHVNILFAPNGQVTS